MAAHQGYFLTKLNAGTALFKTGLVTYRSDKWRIKAPFKVYNAHFIGNQEADVTHQSGGYITPNFYLDLYRRIVVIPHTVNLGAISTDQTFNVQIWNANRSAVKLLSVSVVGGEGIKLEGPTSGIFNPLALKKWTVNVGMQGAPTIDCVVTFNFLGKSAVTLRIIGSRSTDWSFMPDWSEDVTENLQWLTSVHQSVTAAEQRIARRLSPRRTFEFKVSFGDVERQRFEAALYGYGSRVWSMPIFTDSAQLLQNVQQGATELAINTAGYDFAVGGRAILITGKNKEMVEISALESNKIKLKRAVVGNYDRTLTTVYPIAAGKYTRFVLDYKILSYAQRKGKCRVIVQLLSGAEVVKSYPSELLGDWTTDDWHPQQVADSLAQNVDKIRVRIEVQPGVSRNALAFRDITIRVGHK
ncbi:hypothetical protein [Aggregatibacter actinomycetemcomitans]|uniref:hypothetical protein n=1 Tax=Aggregatibacter actinomycetemcomitans TaxID=714 RepID=UPI00201D8520|nr:hypothetical protein [Aggregatibacter actinomycetemcomitans]